MPFEKLKIFISWSGQPKPGCREGLSRLAARCTAVGRTVDVCRRRGKRGRVEPGCFRRTGKSKFSIICLTPENLTSPWLLFKSSGLSKHADSRTLLYELEYSDLKDPLSQFQHTRATEPEMRKLIEIINKHTGELLCPRTASNEHSKNGGRT
jgi:hypothetical protein